MAKKNYALERIFNSTLSITGGPKSALRSMNADLKAIGREVGARPENVRIWIRKRRAEL